MNQISWEHFDGIRFQKFCNELLLFEVSKFATVFSAAGADGGIDQLYGGHYAGKEGRWRFQDKFHNSGNKTKDVNALKSDIKTDIASNYQNENFLVFISNVNLSPKQYKEISVFAQSELSRLHILSEVIIWHRATIEAFLSGHPILYHWNWSSSTIILQSHLEYFKGQLISASTKRNNFCNPFFGRNEEIEKLANFLAEDEKFSLALTANGGYGKTRLCIEFMNQVIKSDNDWIPLVVSHQGYNGNEFSRLLMEQKKLLILLDNANEVPELLDDIKRQTEGTGGRVKLLITTRNTLFNQTLKRISSYNRDIEKIELKRLTPSETLTMLEAELPFVSKRNLIALRDISKGVPNVVVELIRTIKSGKNPNAIAKDNFFTLTISDIIDQAASDVYTTLGIASKTTIEFLQTLSILSPLSNDEAQINFVSNIIGLSNYDTQNLINELASIGLLETTGRIAIRPDPYSDVILTNAFQKVPNLITRICKEEGSSEYVENIIKNLAEAELEGFDKNLFTQQMLYNYFEVISNDTESGSKIKSAVQLASDICIAKPDIAVLVIRKWIGLLGNKSHPIYSQREVYVNKSYVETINTIVNTIFAKLFNRTGYCHGNLSELHFLVEEFIRASHDFKALRSCYTYEHQQFLCLGYSVEQCCKPQGFLKANMIRYMSSSDEFLIALGLEACDVLLQLDFHLDYYYDNINGTFTYGNYYLPECEHSKGIRLEVLNTLIDFYYSKRGTQKLREETFIKLTNHIFHCSPASFERYRFDTHEEVPLILSFCKTVLLEKPSIWERTKIIAVINRYNKGRLKAEFVDRLNELIQLSSALDLPREKLELLLKGEDYFDSRINAGKKFLQLIEEYGDDDKLQDDFLLFSSQRHYLGTPSFNILQALIDDKHAFARALLEKVLSHHIERIGEFGMLIKAFYHDETYFNSVIHRLDANNESQLTTIVWMLIYGRERDNLFFRAKDFEYFQVAVESNNEQAIGYMTSELIHFAFLDEDKVFTLYNGLLKTCRTDAKGSLLYTLFSDESVMNTYPDRLKQFIDENLHSLPVTDIFGGNELLSFIENQFGTDVLCETIKTWLIKRAKENHGYFSIHNYFVNNPKIDETGEANRFCYAVQKYLLLPASELESKVERQLLKMFCPRGGYTQLVSDSVLTMLSELKDDKLQLKAFAKAVSIFPSTTEQLVVDMCRIATYWLQGMESYITVAQVHDFFGFVFYSGPSGRSKSGKGPYPIDVERKNIFEKVIASYDFPDLIRQYLQKCLDKTNQEIANEIENDYLMSGSW